MSDEIREARRTTSKKKTLYIALGVVLLLVAAGAAWAVLGDEPGKTSNERESTSTADATGSVDTPSGDTTLTASEATTTLASEPEGGDLDISYDSGTFPPTIDQMTGEVVGVKASGDSYVLSIDFVQFLTGQEAADAAEAHGEEVPANDFYVVNDNPKVREFPMQAGLTVRVTTNADGTVDPMGRSMSLAEWASAVNGSSADAYRSGTYIVTLTNGVVTVIEQLYLP
ncbi:MAG: hypothetical protein Q7W51_04600 [Coriobacteriia bacterium]|nr:hypothetical protein [Coriobacteriia bacterium]